MVNVTEETRVILHSLGASSIEEVPISLEDAFVSYLGGSLETVRLPGPQASAHHRRRCRMIAVSPGSSRESQVGTIDLCGAGTGRQR